MLRPLQAGCCGLPDRIIFQESHHLATAEPFSRAGPDRTGCRESSNSLATVQALFGWTSCFWVGLKEARGWASEIPMSEFGGSPLSARSLRLPLPATPDRTEGL